MRRLQEIEEAGSSYFMSMQCVVEDLPPELHILFRNKWKKCRPSKLEFRGDETGDVVDQPHVLMEQDSVGGLQLVGLSKTAVDRFPVVCTHIVIV